MVQYSPARVYGAQGSAALQELPVPPRLHEVTQFPAESQARQAIDRVLVGKKKYKSVADLIDAIYKTRSDE